MNRAHRLTAVLGGIALALGGVLIIVPSAHADEPSSQNVTGEITDFGQNTGQDVATCGSGSPFTGLVNVGCVPVTL